MINNKSFFWAIVFSLFCALAFAASDKSSDDTINILYPDNLLNQDFYNSPYNEMVSVTGVISGKKFHGTIPILGVKSVNKLAFNQVKHSLKNMLRGVPDPIKFGIIASNIKIVIIADAHGQKLTQLPEYSNLAAKYDETEGVGATFHTKTQSIGEANVTCRDSTPRRAENVFVHEFAHVVLDIGLGYYNPKNYATEARPPKAPNKYGIDKSTLKRMHKLTNSVENAYQSALSKDIYKANVYMVKNVTEYFAEGSQSYFNAQARSDVNALSEKYKMSLMESSRSVANELDVTDKLALDFIKHTDGVNTYTRLRVFDPDLFGIMRIIYGKHKVWNFCADAPAKISSCRYYCTQDEYDK